MKKIKVTYQDYSGIKAKIIYFSGWYSIGNDISASGINDYQVIKIEVVLDADNGNVEDRTI